MIPMSEHFLFLFQIINVYQLETTCGVNLILLIYTTIAMS